MTEPTVESADPSSVTAPLHRGVYLPPFGPFGDPNVLVDLAIRAETAGWDGIFLWDHVLSDFTPVVDCWTSLAAMATSTRFIKIGPTVTPLPRRRPWIVARQASTVSRLSHGRHIVGSASARTSPGTSPGSARNAHDRSDRGCSTKGSPSCGRCGRVTP